MTKKKLIDLDAFDEAFSKVGHMGGAKALKKQFKKGQLVLDTCGCKYIVVKVTRTNLWLHHPEDKKNDNFYIPLKEADRLKTDWAPF